MKRILHIPNYYPPHVGGIEDVCHSIVSALQGFEQQVICFNDKPQTETGEYEGVRIVRCGTWKKLFSQSVSLAYFGRLRHTLRDFRPDIVHFHTPNPLVSIYLLALLPKNVRFIVHWHSDIVEQGFLYLFFRPFEKILLRRANAIIATSPTYIEGSKPLLAHADKVNVIPNTVNEAKLQPQDGDAETVKAIRLKYNNRPLLFTFGRHVPYKGLSSLLEAVPLINPQTAIVIAGKGPLTESLKAMTSATNVFFPGRISDDELRCYLQAADVFLFPSITRNEAFGIALAEAMYCGLPSVTFTIPASGVNWVCPNGLAGLEVTNRNSTDYAEAVNRLIADIPLRQKLGAHAAKRARERFLINDIIPELVEILNQKD
jgi:glycosyltransferase involved in cell wall biosynthesis